MLRNFICLIQMRKNGNGNHKIEDNSINGISLQYFCVKELRGSIVGYLICWRELPFKVDLVSVAKCQERVFAAGVPA